MATCSIQDLLNEGTCFLAVQSSLLLESIKLSLLCQILQSSNPMASCDVQTLLNSASCFMGRSEEELDAIQTQLLCEIIQAGGGTGNSCITCGPDAPVGVPTCDCAMHYTTGGAVYLWNPSTLAWELILGGP